MFHFIVEHKSPSFILSLYIWFPMKPNKFQKLYEKKKSYRNVFSNIHSLTDLNIPLKQSCLNLSKPVEIAKLRVRH